MHTTKGAHPLPPKFKDRQCEVWRPVGEPAWTAATAVRVLRPAMRWTSFPVEAGGLDEASPAVVPMDRARAAALVVPNHHPDIADPYSEEPPAAALFGTLFELQCQLECHGGRGVMWLGQASRPRPL